MPETIIEFADVMENVVVIRIQGRGTFQNSVFFQRLTQEFRQKNKLIRFILDLDKCTSMDSTFMGTLAGLSTEQNKAGGGYLTVLNAHDHTRRLLVNLGLAYILDIREEETGSLPVRDHKFQEAQTKEPVSKFEQIVHMIEAHERLINLDNKNEVRFQSVLKYLMDSLDKERKKHSLPPEDKK